MLLQTEYFGTNRKATVELLRKQTGFDVWEVTMYQNERVIERKTVSSRNMAESIAEDFTNGGNGESVLLKENF